MPQVAEAPDPFAGTSVGRHRLRDRIGTGPHAAVYLASPPSGPDPLLAFKLFSPEASADPEFSARCFDAAEASRKINHPGVVRVLEVGRHESRGYILMEHAPGGSLEKLLEAERRLPFDRATRILKDVVLALESARAAGQFHLNLKPTNIFLGSDGRARLSDFGQGWQPKFGRPLQAEDPIGGPVEYLSPEQLEGEVPDQAADFFALGVIYYRMLSGKLPFPGVDDREVAMIRVTGAPRPIRESFPGVDPRAIPIVQKLLARRPEARFQSARSLLTTIEPFVKAKTTTNGSKAAVPMPDASVIPSEVRIRLTFSSAASHFGPGLFLIAIAGMLAPGGAGFFASLGSLFSSPTSLAFAGAGLIALAVACFLLRRELRLSGRSRSALGLIAGAAACVLVGTVALDRSLWSGSLGVIFAPVNLLLGSAGLAWFAVARALDLDEHSEGTRLPKVCLGIALPMWFLGWCAMSPTAPFRGFGGATAAVVCLMLAAVGALTAGFLTVTDPTVKLRIRRFGVVLLGAGAVAMGIWASAGALGSLGAPGDWPGAFLKSIATIPSQIPRSGALAILALGLVAAADYAIRGGLIRHFSKK